MILKKTNYIHIQYTFRAEKQKEEPRMWNEYAIYHNSDAYQINTNAIRPSSMMRCCLVNWQLTDGNGTILFETRTGECAIRILLFF